MPVSVFVSYKYLIYLELLGFHKNYKLDSIHIKSKTKVKARNKGCGKSKNRIKLIITSKNFSKIFQFEKISLGIVALFIKFFIMEPMEFTIFF